ncbi:DUF4865 family protein [Subtercola endophyticus]|uniref:DUF4865 family protein n=1 Tax=Subtercola endophyticus TaxID=2895559 RepID=UPI001E636BA1|nr:DUF4865 family protein [Subtercola endophyticus]UFS58863.1 DUF4865 family protein [Subtercola endophyticus]
MLAMQYQITLPADYDMGIIRDRVATRGHALDQYPGLGLKAYLIREAGVHGSTVNQYAPFYLWNAPLAAGTFLWGGDGFGGILRDFGRPVVQTWVGAGFARGPAFEAAPTVALRSIIHVADDADPQPLVAARVDALPALIERPGLHSVAVAVDPRTWQLVQFSLWVGDPVLDQAGSGPAPAPATGHAGAGPAVAGMGSDVERYEVLHLSAPGLARLARR